MNKPRTSGAFLLQATQGIYSDNSDRFSAQLPDRLMGMMSSPGNNIRQFSYEDDPVSKWLCRTAAFLPAILLISVIAVFGWKNPETARLDEATRLKLPGSFMQLADGYTWYDLGGNQAGQPVVLLHGFAINSSIWNPNVAALEQAGFNTLRYDQFGRGYSDRPARLHDQSLFVRQLRELLDNLWISRPVDLVCVSAGCPIAANFARTAPQRVRRIIMVDPQMTAFSLESWKRLPLLGELDALFGLDELANVITTAYPGIAAPYREQIGFKGYRRSLLNILRAQAGKDPMDSYALVAAAGIPVHLVEGELDKGQTRRSTFMQRASPYNYVEIPGAKHGANFHAPEAVNAALLKLLSLPTEPAAAQAATIHQGR